MTLYSPYGSNILSSFLKPNDSCFLNIVKTEGLAAVMKGVRAPVYAQTFNNAILFGTERFCDRNINIKVNRWCFSSILLLIYLRSFIRSMFEQYFPQESIFHNILVKHKYTRVFVSGCISGLVVSLIDTPFDLVKTQLQNQGSASQTS